MKAVSVHRLRCAQVSSWFLSRAAQSSKGSYGHVLIVAGSRGMGGAAALAAWGAYRGGAGLATVAVVKSLFGMIVKRAPLEAMVLSLPESAAGGLTAGSLRKLKEYMIRRKITSLAVGPGLSLNSGTRAFMHALLQWLARSRFPLQCLVLDADGFMALKPRASEPLNPFALPIIVTPHSRELARFMNISTDAVEFQRLVVAEKFAKLNRVITLLKGSGTVITDGRQTFINTTGNPGMATGGSGDVLTGLISALSGNLRTDLSDPLLKIACAGAYLHGAAGDLAAKKTGELSLMATDIASFLPLAVKHLLGA